MENFDAIVVGAGSGLRISSGLAAKGKKVALVEKGPMGGTCLNRGCIPSKIVIHSADVMDSVRRAGDFGIHLTGKTRVDFASITRRASRIVDKDAREIEKGVIASGISLFKGEGKFIGERAMKIGSSKIKGDQIFIMAGTRPSIPPIEGLKGSGFITSKEALRLEKQPKHLIVLGGGAIAAELAHFYGALGTKITIIQRSILLKKEDQEIARAFVKAFSRKHTVLEGFQVDKVKKKAGGFQVHISSKDMKKKKIVEGDQLLVATGRIPNSDTLQVEKAGIKTNKRGYIETNDYLETSAPGVWAAGDIAGKFLFKHSANLEAEYALHNSQNPGKKTRVDYTAMPRAIFSSPQIAAVGFTEEELEAKKKEYVVGKYAYKSTGMGIALQEKEGFVKLLVSTDKKILGCHILGPDASVLIQEVILAMKFSGARLEALVNSIHIHPALSEVVQRAAASLA